MTRSACLRCGPTTLKQVMPLLDGTPVLMCLLCHRIDTAGTWESRSVTPPQHVHRHQWRGEDYVCGCGDVMPRGLWR